MELFAKTSFCTCSYIKSLRDHRASLVRNSIDSWNEFLELPFVERIFLDDGSPDVNGIRLLKSSKSINKFDEVRYNTLIHPPHSNFGIVYSMNICRGEYILHLDDDINVTGSYQECLNLLTKCLEILEQDESILGINLLTMPKEFRQEWFPGEDYKDDFAHPQKYYGTAACLIRKTLLEKVSLADIINWGAQQPNYWEVLVSDSASSFLVSKVPTTFGLNLDAWVYQSVSHNNFRAIKKRFKYNLSKNFPFVKKFISKGKKTT